MLCFRDMTFCAAECANADCERRLTPEVRAAAFDWWRGPGAPMAVADFSPRCAIYQPHTPTEGVTTPDGGRKP